MEVLKNLRSSTLTKMLRATMPTKMAASHSMPLMKRSAKFFFMESRSSRGRPALAAGTAPGGRRAYRAALYFTRLALSESITFFGSWPVLRTASAHCDSPGAVASRQALSCSGVSL